MSQSSAAVKYKSHLKRKYGMTVDQYDKLLRQQKGVCAICGLRPADGKRLYIDHSHDTGEIRGLLCKGCNDGIARLGDNVEGVQKAVAYLARRPHDKKVRVTGHPPSAQHTIAVDFDATLYPFGDLLGYPKPIRGAPEFVREIKARGYRVVIFTSRLSQSWWDAEGWDRREAKRVQLAYVKHVLERDDIPYDLITSEKVPAVWYVDDKSLNFDGSNWKAILERIPNLG